MSINDLVCNVLGLQHPNPPFLQDIPEVLAIGQFLIENGVNPQRLIVSQLILHFESANDSSIVTGFRLNKNVTNAPCNLHFDWDYKDIFVGWSIDQNQYYVTARENSQHLSESVYFDHLDDIQQGLDSLESKIQRAIADY
jgi:hypothetical protein